MKDQIYRVLLLEDNPGDVRLVSGCLQDSFGSSFAVIKVNELKTALKELKKKKFDIALIDLFLPDAKGEEILKAIRNEAPSLPLVVLTGTFHEEAMAVKTSKMGAQDYLTKDHLDANILRRAIRHAMERKGIEQELVKKNEQLRELDRLKVEFINTISHEFRTPLTVVKGEIDNLLSGVAGTFSEKQVHCLEMAQKNINRFVNLLENILDLTRLESGRAKIHFQSLPFYPAPIFSGGGSAMKILVVDDEPDMVSLLTESLVREDFQVITAFDGVRAIEEAHKQKPDLILLDLKMPAGTGQSVLKALKGHAETNKIPVIVITGLVGKDLEKEVRGAGAIDFVRKPFEMQGLIEKIKSVCALRATA